jgi:hypothetical protein
MRHATARLIAGHVTELMKNAAWAIREGIMHLGLTRTALLISAFAVFTPITAQAADPGSCREYATAAINQVRGALNNPRCMAGVQGARWSSDFNVHYSWCLGASYAAMGSERDARTAYLRGCR